MPSRFLRHPRFIGLLTAVLALALLAGASWSLRLAPALTIAGEELTHEELDFHLHRLSPRATDEARRTGAEPTRLLAQRVLDQTAEDHALLVVAHEQGVLSSTAFADLMALQQQTNAERAESLRQGEVVYGLTEYDQGEFYDHLLAAARTEVGQRLSDQPGDPLHAIDADVEAYFAAHADRWRTNATRYDVVTLAVPTASAQDAGCRELLTGDVGAAYLAESVGCPTATIQRTALDGGEPAPQNSPAARLLQSVSVLEVGTTAPATSTPDHIQRVGLLSTETDTDDALEQYRPRVRQALLDEQLTTYLDQRRAALDVDADLDRLTELAQETTS